MLKYGFSQQQTCAMKRSRNDRDREFVLCPLMNPFTFSLACVYVNDVTLGRITTIIVYMKTKENKLSFRNWFFRVARKFCLSFACNEMQAITEKHLYYERL